MRHLVAGSQAVLACSCWLSVWPGPAAADPPEFIVIEPPAGYTTSSARAVSADGSVVVGAIGAAAVPPSNPGVTRAFRWTRSGGVQDLGALPGDMWSQASSVSGDGSVVVGYSSYPAPQRAIRWTQSEGMVDLGPAVNGTPGALFATSVSSDGQAIAGYLSGTHVWPWRWTAATGVTPFDFFGEVMCISADGRVLAGDQYGLGFRWDGALEPLAGAPGYPGVRPLAISADGSVIVGYAEWNYHYAPFRWTRARGSELLPTGGDDWGYAFGVDGAGSIIIGIASGIGETVWAPKLGPLSIASLMADWGLSPGDLRLFEPDAISADGHVIVGTGHYADGRTRGWILRVPDGGLCYANCDRSLVPPVLNIADFICFMNRYAAGDSYANCDGSVLPPVLNVSDFLCFMNEFATGCR